VIGSAHGKGGNGRERQKGATAPGDGSQPDATDPSTSIALAALYIAVATLARDLGGWGASVTATAIGAVLAVLLLLSSRDRATSRTQTLMIAMAVTVAALAGLSGYEANDRLTKRSDREAIRDAILDGYEAEIGWYQHPSEDRRGELGRYFLTPEEGGERMTVIEAAINRLRRCHYRVGAEAKHTTFVSSISIAGSTAEAHTVQSVFQPSYMLENGRWVLRDLEPASEDFSVEDQIYVLRRSSGRWKVASSPQEQNIRKC
jgi:hypothetical protein